MRRQSRTSARFVQRAPSQSNICLISPTLLALCVAAGSEYLTFQQILGYDRDATIEYGKAAFGGDQGSSCSSGRSGTRSDDNDADAGAPSSTAVHDPSIAIGCGVHIIEAGSDEDADAGDWYNEEGDVAEERVDRGDNDSSGVDLNAAGADAGAAAPAPSTSPTNKRGVSFAVDLTHHQKHQHPQHDDRHDRHADGAAGGSSDTVAPLVEQSGPGRPASGSAASQRSSQRLQDNSEVAAEAVRMARASSVSAALASRPPRAILRFPTWMPEPARDLILQLLHPDPSKRLGVVGIDEEGSQPSGSAPSSASSKRCGPVLLDYSLIKSHPFFSGIDWKSVIDQKHTVAPYQPPARHLPEPGIMMQQYQQQTPFFGAVDGGGAGGGGANYVSLADIDSLSDLSQLSAFVGQQSQQQPMVPVQIHSARGTPRFGAATALQMNAADLAGAAPAVNIYSTSAAILASPSQQQQQQQPFLPPLAPIRRPISIPASLTTAAAAGSAAALDPQYQLHHQQQSVIHRISDDASMALEAAAAGSSGIAGSSSSGNSGSRPGTPGRTSPMHYAAGTAPTAAVAAASALPPPATPSSSGSVAPPRPTIGSRLLSSIFGGSSSSTPTAISTAATATAAAVATAPTAGASVSVAAASSGAAASTGAPSTATPSSASGSRSGSRRSSFAAMFTGVAGGSGTGASGTAQAISSTELHAAGAAFTGAAASASSAVDVTASAARSPVSSAASVSSAHLHAADTTTSSAAAPAATVPPTSSSSTDARPPSPLPTARLMLVPDECDGDGGGGGGGDNRGIIGSSSGAGEASGGTKDAVGCASSAAGSAGSASGTGAPVAATLLSFLREDHIPRLLQSDVPADSNGNVNAASDTALHTGHAAATAGIVDGPGLPTPGTGHTAAHPQHHQQSPPPSQHQPPPVVDSGSVTVATTSWAQYLDSAGGEYAVRWGPVVRRKTYGAIFNRDKTRELVLTRGGPTGPRLLYLHSPSNVLRGIISLSDPDLSVMLREGKPGGASLPSGAAQGGQAAAAAGAGTDSAGGAGQASSSSSSFARFTQWLGLGFGAAASASSTGGAGTKQQPSSSSASGDHAAGAATSAASSSAPVSGEGDASLGTDTDGRSGALGIASSLTPQPGALSFPSPSPDRRISRAHSKSLLLAQALSGHLDFPSQSPVVQEAADEDGDDGYDAAAAAAAAAAVAEAVADAVGAGSSADGGEAAATTSSSAAGGITAHTVGRSRSFDAMVGGHTSLTTTAYKDTNSNNNNTSSKHNSSSGSLVGIGGDRSPVPGQSTRAGVSSPAPAAASAVGTGQWSPRLSRAATSDRNVAMGGDVDGDDTGAGGAAGAGAADAANTNTGNINGSSSSSHLDLMPPTLAELVAAAEPVPEEAETWTEAGGINYDREDDPAGISGLLAAAGVSLAEYAAETGRRHSAPEHIPLSMVAAAIKATSGGHSSSSGNILAGSSSSGGSGVQFNPLGHARATSNSPSPAIHPSAAASASEVNVADDGGGGGGASTPATTPLGIPASGGVEVVPTTGGAAADAAATAATAIPASGGVAAAAAAVSSEASAPPLMLPSPTDTKTPVGDTAAIANPVSSSSTAAAVSSASSTTPASSTPARPASTGSQLPPPLQPAPTPAVLPAPALPLASQPPFSRERGIFDIHTGNKSSSGGRIYYLYDPLGAAAAWREAIMTAKTEALELAAGAAPED